MRNSDPLKDDKDYSTGRVRETLLLTNDETDYSTWRVELPNHLSTRQIPARGVQKRLSRTKRQMKERDV